MISKLLIYCSLLLVVVIHYLVVVSNVISCFIIPFIFPWYVAVSIISGIVSLLTTRNSCPLTDLENKLRKKLGMKPIKGFIKAYVINVKSTLKELLYL